MLVIELNRENLEYDVQALVQAFFSEEQVEVLIPESRADKREKLSDQVRIRVTAREGNAGIEVSVDRSLCCPDKAVTAVTEPGTALVYKWSPAEGETDKQDFKAFFYQIMSQVTGKQLPWGMLTGIRPTKIAFCLLEDGVEQREIVRHYQEKYLVSAEKGALAVDIAERERKLLGRAHCEVGYSRECSSGYSRECSSGYSLYLGIPFCPTTCLYCSFTSYPIAGYKAKVDAYLDCLLREAEHMAECFKGKILDSVYIGGGTPTTLEPEQLERLIVRLRELFDFAAVQEFTVEAGRADSITEEKLRTLYRHGVTRISVNPQTMKQETLDLIGRKTRVEQVEEAFWLARRVGFDNINMDIILGLPGETAADVQHTIDRLVELGPDSLTVHSLAVKRASGLNRWIQENGVSMLRNTDETMAIAAEGAERLGMAPYYLYRQKNMSGNFENVGYAREGKYGLYNILINEEKQTILALGAGSITKRVYPDGRIERCENVKEVVQYIERIEEMIERKRSLLEAP